MASCLFLIAIAGAWIFAARSQDASNGQIETGLNAQTGTSPVSKSAAFGATATARTDDGSSALGKRPLIIGHRGACGYRPEHTLASYRLAIEMGADFIEPDLVVTKDRVLIARHENDISSTTDVADKFPERKTKKNIDGKSIEGFFAEDFTLAEIKTLRAKERLAFRDHSFDGKFEIATFDEIIDLAKQSRTRDGKPMSVYPETKHPSYFRSIGYELEPLVAAKLKERGWLERRSPVILQSAELSSLKRLRDLGVETRMMLLLDEPSGRAYDFVLAHDPRLYADMTKPENLNEIAKTAQGIGPWKGLIVPLAPDGHALAPTSLIEDAHAAGLFVHPYTFRAEAQYLAPEYHGKLEAELEQFFELGVDGVFTDFADRGHAARAEFLESQTR